MSFPLGVGSAVAAGGSFAAAGVLQQRVAARTSGRRSLSVGLLAALARQPMWLAGIGLAAAAYGLQALALSAAPLAVVQPLLVTELVFAIPISARLSGHRLRLREWTGIALVGAGVAAVVWGEAGTGPGAGGTVLRWVLVGGALTSTAVTLALVGRRRRPVLRASLYAAAAALVFALSSALLARAVAGFAADGLGGLARPAPYAMAVASLGGLLLIQSAFQSGPLAVTMPMVDWLEPLVAVVLGVSVLNEPLDTTPAHLLALAVGALGALAGIVTLDTSPRVRPRQPDVNAPPADRLPARAGDVAALACTCRAARRTPAPVGAEPAYPADQPATGAGPQNPSRTRDPAVAGVRERRPTVARGVPRATRRVPDGRLRWD